MAPDYWVARLNGADAAIVWPKVEAMLAKAIAGSRGLFEPEDVRERVTRPEAGTARGWALWIICERDQLLGAWTTAPQFYPRETVLEVVFAGGSGMKRFYGLAIAETEKFAVESGCRRVRCGGRRGWSRFGWQPIGHVFERKFA